MAVESLEAGQERSWRQARLTRHADYQRVYRESRKQFSPSLSYFFRLRSSETHAEQASGALAGPRIGLTAGRVLGKAVERNRIKRRMREAVRANLPLLTAEVDVVLHPRRTVLEIDFAKLQREVARIFKTIQQAAAREAK